MMVAVEAKVRTALALGLPNLARVGRYRLGLRFAIHPVQEVQAEAPRAPFFKPANSPVDAVAPAAWRGEALYFGWHGVELPDGRCPDWHANPFLPGARQDATRPWWQLPDFDPRVGDIKTVWEASRMDWVLAMAQRAAAGERQELDRLNGWIADWCASNPPYLGPNWKCGQEASIRVMHLAMAALILGQTNAPAQGLLDLVTVHLRRIRPVINYAIAQDNNHGTSEAAALYIGGSWLRKLGVANGGDWEATGRKWLENRVARLVEEDGSFSQYSVNYHRVFLDTMSMVEAWRRRLGLPSFSDLWRSRVEAAARWLHAMTDSRTGDTPNIGANDGARLLPLVDADHRDFRPSVHLAAVLFLEKRAYAESGAWDDALRWLGVATPRESLVPPSSALYDSGGYAVLRRGEGMAVLRYPRFRFRPSHADALHVDLWVRGENVLRDAGAYSYALSPELVAAFAGVSGHNTIQFDGRDQMPRLGRFLFGDWLQANPVSGLKEEADAIGVEASYRDRKGVIHRRKVSLRDDCIGVADTVAGFADKAVLRWRLKPGAWRIQGNGVTDGFHTLTVDGDAPFDRVQLVEGWESRYYMRKTPVPVLEIEIHQPGTLRTVYRW